MEGDLSFQFQDAVLSAFQRKSFAFLLNFYVVSFAGLPCTVLDRSGLSFKSISFSLIVLLSSALSCAPTGTPSSLSSMLLTGFQAIAIQALAVSNLRAL